MIQDNLFFEAALTGLEYQKRETEARIAQIREQLTAQQPVAARKGVAVERHAKRRRMSAAGRAAIAAAARKRWAEYNAAKAGKRVRRAA